MIRWETSRGVEGGNDTDPRGAHGFKRAFLREFALSHNLYLSGIQAALDQGLCQCSELCSPGNEDEDAIGAGNFGALYQG